MLLVNTSAIKVAEEKVVLEKKIGNKFETETFPMWALIILWIVSLLACVFNVMVIATAKVFCPTTPVKHILWKIGRNKWHFSSPFVDWFNRHNHLAKVEAAGQGALNLFYHYPDRILPKLNGGIRDRITKFWMNIDNRKAVRNRVNMITDELEQAFLKAYDRDGEVRLVSLASGSFEAGINAMKRVPWIPLKAILIDLDPDALKSAEVMVEEAGLSKHFFFINGKTTLLEDAEEALGWVNVIEMAGFADYRTDDELVRLFGRIKRVLKPGGSFITCNIAPNLEKIFLDWVLLWPMIYRTKEQLAGILENAGFKKGLVFCEPLKIHSIGVCEA